MERDGDKETNYYLAAPIGSTEAKFQRDDST